MFDGTAINWSNCWRTFFILALLAIIFGVVFEWETAGKILGGIDAVLGVFLIVIRFDDVKEFMDSGPPAENVAAHSVAYC